MTFTGHFKAENLIAAYGFYIVPVYQKVDPLKTAAFQLIHPELEHDPAKALILLPRQHCKPGQFTFGIYVLIPAGKKLFSHTSTPCVRSEAISML